MQSFSLANNAAGVVDLTTAGALREGSNGLVLAGTNVNSFAVGNSGQTVYWLTDTGSQNQSINGGPGVYSNLYPLTPNSLNINAVQSFALADSGQAIVFQQTNGGLTESDPGFGTSPTSLAANGVQSFVVGNGGQDVYWLTSGGSLSQSINGGPGVYSNLYPLTPNSLNINAGAVFCPGG